MSSSLSSSGSTSALPPSPSSSPYLTEFYLYEDLSEYEKEESPYAPKGKGEQRTSHTHPSPPSPQFAVVLHAVPTKFKLGEVHRWLEEDNKYLSIAGARWLLTKDWRGGKSHSSVVLYLQDPTIASSLRLGRKSLRITTYDWDR